jgi:hypothetical protein
MQILSSSVAGAVQHKATQQQRQAAQVAQVYDQTGKTLITITAPAGVTPVVGTSYTVESTVTIPFVQTFTEEPLFTFGSALDTNQSATAGAFPTASATVLSWNVSVVGASQAFYGATVGIVASGTDGLKMHIHYSFVGKALSFPVSASSVNSTGSA